MTLILFLTLSCSVIRQRDSVAENITKCVPTEIYRDTLTLEGLAKTCKTHNIHPSMSEKTLITYYELVGDVAEEFVYADDRGKTFVISKCPDGMYIFTVSVKNP